MDLDAFRREKMLVAILMVDANLILRSVAGAEALGALLESQCVNLFQIKCVKFFSDTKDSSSGDELIQESNVQQHGAYFDKNYYQNRN